MLHRLLCVFLLVFCVSGFSQNPEAALQSARAKWKQKKYREAVMDYDKVLQKEKDNFLAFLERGQVKYEMGKKDDAYKDFDKAVSLNKDYFQSLMVRANAWDNDRNYAKAIEDYSRVLQVNPANTEAPVLRGLALIKTGKLREADKDFDAVISKNTKNYKAWYGRALVAEKEKKYADAIQACSKALELKKDAGEVLYCRARAQAAQGKNQASLADFVRAVTLGETSEQAWIDYAQAALACGSHEAVQTCLTQLSVKLKSKDPRIPYMRAQAAFVKNDWGSAAREYTRILSTESKSVKAYLERGKCYYLMGSGKYVLALNDFRKATEVEDKNEEAWFGYGKMSFEMQQYQPGADALSRAITLKPTAEAFYLRSKCYYKLKKQKECCADLKKSVDMGIAEAQKDMDRVCR